MSASMENQNSTSTSANTETIATSMGKMDLNGSAPGKQGEEVTQPSSLIPLEPLYKLCMKYYKDNIGNALSIPYKEKTYLLALHKQVTCGKYKAETGQEPGFLDVVGNDRKQAWLALGDMSKENAMKEFIKVLHKCSPSLKPYLYAYKVQQEEEQEKIRQAEAEQKKREEEEAERARQAAAVSQQATAGQQNAGAQQVLQEQQVRQALNQQTEAQFRSYAQSQFPNSIDQQDALIKQLQEQHFQQYVRQMYEQQLQQQAATSSAANTSQGSGGAGGAAGVGPQSIALQGTTHDEKINGALESTSHTDIVLQEASMWTQKDVMGFKNIIKKESKMENHTDCIIKVGSGETVTIRVPTHENGNCLFWEFATDHYDIAFGVYFEWTESTTDNVQVHVSDSSDEDEEEGGSDDKSDAEKGDGRSEKQRGPPMDEIIPIYRRDSHEEVYCGSHVYPGRGVYLLKFDNSYSLWRSKTLYYRVYYSR